MYVCGRLTHKFDINLPKGSANVMILQYRSIVVQQGKVCADINMKVIRSSGMLKIMNYGSKQKRKDFQICKHVLLKHTHKENKSLYYTNALVHIYLKIK